MQKTNKTYAKVITVLLAVFFVVTAVFMLVPKANTYAENEKVIIQEAVSDGFTVEFSELEEKDYGFYLNKLDKGEKIGALYHIKIKWGEHTYLTKENETITLKVAIPENMKDINYRVVSYMNGVRTDLDHEVDGDYVVVELEKFYHIAFVYTPSSLLWVIVLLSAIVGALLAVLVWKLPKKNKTYSIALLLAPIFVEGQMLAIIILGVLAVGLGIAVAVVIAKGKKVEEQPIVEEPKEEVIEEPKQEEIKEEVTEPETKEVVEETATEEVKEEVVEETTAEAEEVAEEKAEEVTEEVVEEPIAEESEVQEEVIEETAIQEDNQEEVEEIEEEIQEETEEFRGIDELTGLAIIARYKKSFTARLIQSPDTTKNYYSTLKNAILSYKKVKSRVSWNYDSINNGRNKLIKFNVRGKTLNVYFALNAQDYVDTKYKVIATETKKYAETPCLYKITSDRKCKYALELIEVLAEKFGLKKGEDANENYVYPYETTEALIQKELIKELITEEDYQAYLARKQSTITNAVEEDEEVIEEAVTEEVVEETATEIVEEPIIEDVEETEEDEEEVQEETIVLRGVDEATGLAIVARYKKSFMARLIQSPDKTKGYYEKLMNAILSYKKVKSRVSWNYDSINNGRNKLIKFNVRGKTLNVYFALNAQDYVDTKYKVIATETKKYAETPCLYKITSDRKCKYALELIEVLAEKFGLKKGEDANENYVYPYETTEALIRKGLIKELVSTETMEEYLSHQHAEVVEDEIVEDALEEPIVEETIEEVSETAATEEVVEEAAETVEETTTIEEVSEVQEEVVVEETVVEEITQEVVTTEEVIETVKETATVEEISEVQEETNDLSDLELDAETFQEIEQEFGNELAADGELEDVNVEELLAEIQEDMTDEEIISKVEEVIEETEEVATTEETTVEETIEVQEETETEEVVETVEEVVEEPSTEEVAPVEHVYEVSEEEHIHSQEEVDAHHVDKVSATEVDDIISDEVAKGIVEIIKEKSAKIKGNRKAVVNVDTISRCFNAGDIVNLETLKEKGLIAKNTARVKVLARGSIDKPLHVELNDYSIEAIKMIALTGGTVAKVQKV